MATQTIKTPAPGTIFNSDNSGPYKVLYQAENVINKNGDSIRMIAIQFLITGTILIRPIYSVLKGNIKDPYYPRIFGVACLGMASEKDDPRAFTIWKSMIKRCYWSGDCQYHNYGGIGIKVCDRWLCFEYFLQDLPSLPGYSDWFNSTSQKYHMDKDKLQQNIPKNLRIYSPNTCCFISREENEILMYRENYTNKYIGVMQYGNMYKASFYNNGIRKTMYGFKTPEAAACVRDFWAYMENRPKLNNVDINIDDAMKNRNNFGREKLYKLINK